MSEKELSEKKLVLPQVKRELAAIGEENLDQFQRRTFDYVSKFSRVDEAVQVVNCAPESVEELRVFLAGGRKIIETAKLEAIVSLLNESRVVKE